MSIYTLETEEEIVKFLNLVTEAKDLGVNTKQPPPERDVEVEGSAQDLCDALCFYAQCYNVALSDVVISNTSMGGDPWYVMRAPKCNIDLCSFRTKESMKVLELLNRAARLENQKKQKEDIKERELYEKLRKKYEDL